jgi:hypothetical protein
LPHLATPATASAAALKAIAQWRRRLVAASGGEPRATALLAHFLQGSGAEVVSVESLFAWLFVDEGPHACLSFLRPGDGDDSGDSGGEKRAVWLALALPVAWLVKKMKTVAGAPEFVVSETNLVKLCGWVRQADAAGDVEVTVLLARCLGVFFLLSTRTHTRHTTRNTAHTSQMAKRTWQGEQMLAATPLHDKRSKNCWHTTTHRPSFWVRSCQ